MLKTRSAHRNASLDAADDIRHAHDRCLVELQTPDPRHDKTRIVETNGGLLQDTYRWILDNPDFRRWRDGRKRRLLWIKGDPGKGKTMQLCGIIDELEKTTINPGLLSFFFCQGTDSRSNNATAVLRGLICLLVQRQPSLLRHIHKKRKCVRKEPFEDANAWAALSGIFGEILRDPALKHHGAYFIIDALDECVTDLPSLLDLIIRTLSVFPHVRWIISACHSPQIEESLRISEQKAELCLESNPEPVSAAVRTYIQRKVHQLAQLNKYDTETESAIRDQLANANGTFLWVALVCQSLTNAPQSDSLSLLRTFPLDVDSLYAHMVGKIESSDHVDLCKRVLAVATVVRRPITLQELSIFVELQEDTSDDLASLAEIVRHCGAFLTLRESTIYFVHPSAKDFLLAKLKASDSVFAALTDKVNRTIFSKSIGVMSRTLRRDMYNLQYPGFPIDQVRKPDIDPLAEVQYSCVYWVDHLCDLYPTKTTNTSDNDSDLASGEHVHTFLREKYLYWLEALSLLGSLSEGVRAMGKLEDLLKQLELPTPLIDLVQDARQFVTTHRWVIENAPLQTYASALVFTPPSSLVRALFKAEEPSWIIKKPHIDADRNARLHAGGHSGPVWSVAFSPANSQLVASASDDKTIRTWDVATGTYIQTLQGHNDWIWSIAFSRDGNQLVSAADDGTVNIWDITTGRCIRTLDGHGDGAFSAALTLKGHLNSVWCVAFSRNGEQIASGSNDDTIKIWDATTGECLRTLKGHSDSIRSVAFWRNSQVASASMDTTVRIWDVKSGRCLRTLKGHEGHVRSLAYSHNGHQLASGASDVKIWDVSTGKCLRTFKSNRFSLVSYSHDDALIAVGSRYDSIIRILDTWTGDSVRTLKGHRTDTSSLAFSRRGFLLASGSKDGVLRIWDARTGACLQKYDGHTHPTWSVAFSPGGQQVVSVSGDRTVKIWSTSTGICLQKFKGHPDAIFASAFSHNGQHFVTGSRDNTVKIWDVVYGGSAWSVSFSSDGHRLATSSDSGTVRIWDTTTGNCLQTLKNHTDPVYSTAFSHDSQHLASASDDRTIAISDMQGDCVKKLKGHTGSVWAVAFSPDDQQIASASNDRTVRIWDVLMGACVQTINVDTSLSSLSFDTTGSCLFTELGRIKLDQSQPPPASPSEATGSATSATAITSRLTLGQQVSEEHDYGLSPDRSWVTDNGQNVLWLPPEYRPLSSAVSEQTICIGCRSGRVLFICFSADR